METSAASDAHSAGSAVASMVKVTSKTRSVAVRSMVWNVWTYSPPAPRPSLSPRTSVVAFFMKA